MNNLGQEANGIIVEWRKQPIARNYIYIAQDWMCLRVAGAGEVKNVSVRIAVGSTEYG